MNSQTRDDPSVAHDAVIESMIMVRSSAQSRGHLKAAPAMKENEVGIGKIRCSPA